MRFVLIALLWLTAAQSVGADPLSTPEKKTVTKMLKAVWPKATEGQLNQVMSYLASAPSIDGDDALVIGAGIKAGRALRSAVEKQSRGDMPDDDQLSTLIAYMVIGARAAGATAPTGQQMASYSRGVVRVTALVAALTALGVSSSNLVAISEPVVSAKAAFDNLNLSISNLQFVGAVLAFQAFNIWYQWLPGLEYKKRLFVPGVRSVLQSRNSDRALRLFFDTFTTEATGNGVQLPRSEDTTVEQWVKLTRHKMLKLWSQDQIEAACAPMLEGTMPTESIKPAS